MTVADENVNPTFLFANDNGADSNDYSGVSVGAKASDVSSAYYFDFLTLTSASDGSQDATTTEQEATFRFGTTQAACATANGAGDVCINEKLEIQDTAKMAKVSEW